LFSRTASSSFDRILIQTDDQPSKQRTTAPVANDNNTTPLNTPVTISILANDTDTGTIL
jgi:hypothetical protein